MDSDDEWTTPTFAFHDLDYIPSGYSGILAPYIETSAGTMRAAATLMRLDLLSASPSSSPSPPQSIVCDLGCGDGEFLIGLLAHLNRDSARTAAVHGFGIDYNAALLETAALNAVSAGETVRWLAYDFNADLDDLSAKLALARVTHVFVYLVPKQLALQTVRAILEGLCASGVVVCCHKFQPTYLTPTRRDLLMDLVVYERGGQENESSLR